MPRSIEKIITSLDSTHRKLEHELENHGVYDDILEQLDELVARLEEINEEINQASKEDE